MSNDNRFQRYIFTPNRRTALLAALVAAGIGIVFLIVQRQSPGEWRNATSGGEGLTVMSFNVLKGGKPVSDAIDAVEAADPDLICLPEMTAELAAEFEARLGSRYPHRLLEPHPNAQGIGIASRHPLADGRVDMLGLRFLPSLMVTVRVPSAEIHIACIHLVPPQAGFGKSDDLWATYQINKSRRLGQIAELLKRLDGLDMPAIIMGDMNEWPGQAAVAALAEAGFRDSCYAPGGHCGPTWPGRTLSWPATFRIDYILGRDVRFADSAVLEAGGSDHYPVAARIVAVSKPPESTAYASSR